MGARVVVFVSYGSFGDVNPLLAVAQRLAAVRPVRFVGNEHYRAHVEAAGVPFVGAGTEEEQAACRDTQRSSGRSMEGLLTQFRHHVGRNVPRLLERLGGWHRDGESLLVVTHGTLNPAFPACEALGLPVVRAFYAPSHLPLDREGFLLERELEGRAAWWSRAVHYPRHALRIRWSGPPHARREYDRFRAASGIGPALPPYRQAWRRLLGRPFLGLNVVANLLLTPEWFAGSLDGAWPRGLRCTGFPFFERASAGERVLDELIERHGPPVVFTPGSGVEDLDDFCRPIESACRKIGAPGVLLARHGREAFARLSRVLSHPVVHVEHADLARLLPRARLLVHHGGIGTAAQAIRAGVPQIVRPAMYDQPGNALRVALNGLGGVLRGPVSGGTIAALYRDLAGSELHRGCLAQCAEQVRGEDGAQNAADVLATLAVDAPGTAAVRAVASGPAALPGALPR